MPCQWHTLHPSAEDSAHFIDKNAVKQAEQRADKQRNEQCRDKAPQIAQLCKDNAAGGQDRADREVKFPAQQRIGHAEADDALNGYLQHEVLQVALLQRLAAGQDGGDKDDHELPQNAHCHEHQRNNSVQRPVNDRSKSSLTPLSNDSLVV